MVRATTGLYLAALLVSICMNSVLRADETVMQDSFFTADEPRHQWVNELNGRTGQLLVSGALLSSPCTLMTNEVQLPLPEYGEIIKHYELKLNLRGCGYGDVMLSSTSATERNSITVMQSTLLTKEEGGMLHPKQQLVSAGRAFVYNGANQLTYRLNKKQQMALTNAQAKNRAQGNTYTNPQNDNYLLSLRLDYE
ncbi:pilus-assembly fibrillin subunit [Escherichia sp. MOD1-EC6163]|uniref:pilus-assembly fibrillin subunit n=1 Tax=Escherichia sp. MOD1-EC6163 TaxID=2093896 RepID=UPI000CF7AFCF|nr:pilus-assembly fibrillin subunit [Escherichia sp. MOD1-EC6163]